MAGSSGVRVRLRSRWEDEGTDSKALKGELSYWDKSKSAGEPLNLFVIIAMIS